MHNGRTFSSDRHGTCTNHATALCDPNVTRWRARSMKPPVVARGGAITPPDFGLRAIRKPYLQTSSAVEPLQLRGHSSLRSLCDRRHSSKYRSTLAFAPAWLSLEAVPASVPAMGYRAGRATGGGGVVVGGGGQRAPARLACRSSTGSRRVLLNWTGTCSSSRVPDPPTRLEI